MEIDGNGQFDWEEVNDDFDIFSFTPRRPSRIKEGVAKVFKRAAGKSSAAPKGLRGSVAGKWMILTFP